MVNTDNSSSSNYVRKSEKDFEAIREAQIAHQSKSLDIIEDVAAYLNTFLQKGDSYKVIMRDILIRLNEKYTIEETKIVSQHNYLMMDLANARKNRSMTNDRINIRIMYIQERFKTSYRPELHDRISAIIEKYNTLFAWNSGYIGSKKTTDSKD